MMKNITKKWLEFADTDLKVAKALLDESKKQLYSNCYYHCHQAIEKNLKAILAERNEKIPKIHDLIDLLNKTKIKLPKEITNFIDDLNPYYHPIRYPDSFQELKDEFNKRSTSKSYKLTKETIKWIQHELIKIN